MIHVFDGCLKACAGAATRTRLTIPGCLDCLVLGPMINKFIDVYILKFPKILHLIRGCWVYVMRITENPCERGKGEGRRDDHPRTKISKSLQVYNSFAYTGCKF